MARYERESRPCRAIGASGATIIDDEVRYALPLGILGRLAHPLVRWQLRRIFRYRQDAVARLLG